MQIGGLADSDLGALCWHAVEGIAGILDATLGFRIHGNTAFTAGCRGAAPALGCDQVADAPVTIADNAGRSPDRYRNDLIIDYDKAKILAVIAGFQDHILTDLFGPGDGGIDFSHCFQTNRDALALLAACRFDHDRAMFFEEGGMVFRCCADTLFRDIDAYLVGNPAGDAFVIADRHCDGGSKFAEGLPAIDGATAVAEAEISILCIDDMNKYTPAARLIGDQSGIGVELAVRQFTSIELLIDRVLVLDRKGRDLAKTQLLIKRDCLFIIVQNRQVHIGCAACLEMFGQMADQCFAETGMRRLR